MYWEIKWQCVEVDYDGCLGGLLNDVYTTRCDSWEHAMGEFIAKLNADEIARVWWVVHQDEHDIKGNVMCGYTCQWGERVTLAPIVTREIESF